MNLKKIFILPLMVLSLGCTLASCGNNTRASDELRICVYDGGYGTEWLNQMAKDYEAKTGIKVIPEVDSTILDRIEDQLENVSDYDIYMSHDINWQNYAARGLLANLDDLYSRKVDGFENTTFKDRVIDGALEYSKTAGEDETEHFYKVCYTQGAGGFIYNVDMFKDNGWEVPETYDELVALCNTINEAKIQIDGTRNTVKPFAWSGADRQYYWDYIVYEWWIQLAGDAKIETFKQFSSAEVYNPDGNFKEFIQAYEMWYNLIAIAPENSTTDSYSQKLVSAQAQFANGEVAMIPYAQWAKKEIQNAVGHALDFDIAMMQTPKAVAGAQDYNYLVGFGDSMIIPENTPNKEIAKDFILYMATAEACKTFIEKSEGAFLAFDYSDIDLSSIEVNDTYIKSVHDKLTKSKGFNLASKSEIAIWNVNTFMPWIENQYFYQSACSKPESATPTIIGNDIYKRAKEGWTVWSRNAGIK